MSQKITALLALIAIVLASAGLIYLATKDDSAPETLPAIIPALNSPDKAPPIVRLHNRRSGNFICSGVVISANYVATAAHCTEVMSKAKNGIEVKTNNNVSVKAYGTSVFSEGRSDTALIVGNFSEFNAMTLVNSPVPELQILLGEPQRLVLACGFPWGGQLLCTTLTSRRQRYFGIAAIGVLYPGMSGGPVFDAETGMLVGVNTSVMDNGVYISPLLEILAHANVRQEK